MTERGPHRSEQDGRVDEREARLARARLAFDAGLREATETGARAARRLLVPALWGAALVGGTLIALALLRLVRRPRMAPALLRVTIEPRFESRPLLPAIGSAMARLAMQQFFAAPASDGPAGEHLGATAPAAAATHRGGSSTGSSSNGRAKA